MDDDREAFEFAHALYLARQVDREATQMIVEAAEAGFFFMSASGRKQTLTDLSSGNGSFQ